MMGDGESGGLPSAAIDIMTDGLKEGITCWIGDNTTGRVLDTIGNKIGIESNDDVSKQLNEMNAKINIILGELYDINVKMNKFEYDLSLDTVILENYINAASIAPSIADIENTFGTTPDGGNNVDAYMYYAQHGSQIDPNDQNAVNELKTKTANYVKETSPKQLKDDIQMLHDAMVPSTLSHGLIKGYADDLILKHVNPNSTDPNFPYNPLLADPNNALEVYSSLEAYFAQLLTYQTQACTVIVEINNYTDPNDPTDALGYLNGTYKDYIKDEIIVFENTVNYLVLNLIDYRNFNNYHNDIPYMINQGIAPDNVYLMILARSRFFCAQVMNAFEQDYGLYGTVITPLYNSPDPNNANTRVTLQFTGPVSFTKTVNANKMAGQFPYTRWLKNDSSSNNQCTCDNNWCFYDFSTLNNPSISGDYFDPNIPAGTYNITLVDNNDQSNPWYHQTTNLGQVNLLYYDPNNPSSPGTLAPTTTNTVKFGYFSRRWNWGYNKMCLDSYDVWSVPSSNEVRWNSNGNSQKHDNPTIYPKDLDYADYYPKKSNDPDYMNNMSIRIETDEDYNFGSQCATMYTINYPFIPETPSGGSSIMGTPLTTVFYDTSAAVDYTNSKPSTSDYSYDYLYFDYYIIDRDKSKTYNMYNYSSENDFNLNTTANKYGVYDNSLVLGRKYYASIDAGSTTTEDKYENVSVNAHINLAWYMQVIYNGITYNIFQD